MHPHINSISYKSIRHINILNFVINVHTLFQKLFTPHYQKYIRSGEMIQP